MIQYVINVYLSPIFAWSWSIGGAGVKSLWYQGGPQRFENPGIRLVFYVKPWIEGPGEREPEYVYF